MKKDKNYIWFNDQIIKSGKNVGHYFVFSLIPLTLSIGILNNLKWGDNLPKSSIGYCLRGIAIGTPAAGPWGGLIGGIGGLSYALHHEYFSPEAQAEKLRRAGGPRTKGYQLDFDDAFNKK